jgi:hypothetical protein
MTGNITKDYKRTVVPKLFFSGKILSSKLYDMTGLVKHLRKNIIEVNNFNRMCKRETAVMPKIPLM